MVSASPDAFSDPEPSTQAELVEPARELDAAGAAPIDVGGESRRTDRPAVDEGEEIAPVVPVIEPRGAEGLLVSVDTWRGPVARAALAAAAAMVNDPSGLADPEVAQACAGTGAAPRDYPHPTLPEAQGVPPLRRRRPGRGGAAARARGRGAPARRERRAARLRSGDRPGEDTGRVGGGAPPAGRAAHARAAAAGGRVAQGLRGRSPSARRASASRARSRRTARPSTAAPRSCGCTTSRRRATTCASEPR
jgi:hypothetical protein